MIEIRNLVKSFGEQPVLRGIDLRINDGETVAIIGQSGCGKSVLLKHIIGLLKPDAGDVLVDGLNMSTAKPRAVEKMRRHIGFLFQGAALFDSMSVLENVTLGLREHGLRDEAELARITKEKLALVGLYGIEHQMPSHLSGGMKKRVALARALATEPKYMFYDEPTTGLDPITSDQIDALIEDLTAKLSVTSVIVTHDLFTVERIAKRVIFLHQGRIHFDGKHSELSASADPIVSLFLERYRAPLAIVK
ncbi:MAG: ABC transporter ATP-binding protein [Bacteroidota bacterium]|nr:ABC transporter ATP-binding protein [Bacteroidota bacterium]MDP4231735.1 ABC transporter ATP-binding protein [Bacteroidota bacterium]MDP4243471.1 ABC transporter ATP-binding protein [Bacteroidota bacterium]MDP4289364.1 ABC transporter ATP-binding protein [Bacteroidota bacterium]